MSKRATGLVFSLLICSILVFGGLPAVSAQSRTAAFRSAPCMFDTRGAALGKDVTCGYVQVPEQHDSPGGPQIELAVVIYTHTSSQAAAEPLFLLQGGPGGSTIDTYTSYIGIGRLAKLRQQHDLVLFDQRGTLYSKPALLCSEQWELTTATIEQRLSHAEANRRYLEAQGSCHDRLAGEGINLGAYDSLENADDVEAVRVALGYDMINLYGVSYGSLLALHVMRQHPDHLRSVIIDGVVPTQTNFIPAVAQSQQRAFRELFAACQSDTDCNTAYPNLEQTFFDLVAKLNREPARVPLTDPKTKRTYNAVLDGDTLESWIFQMLYATDIIPALPLVMTQMQAGNFGFASQIVPQIVFDQTLAYGMYNSVVCAEDADFKASDVVLTDVRPEIAKYAVEDAQSILDGCRRWDVPALDPGVDAPVVSDIPTLILNGRFDPITPPANGAQAAQTLSHSYNLTFGFTGHGALTIGACAEQIALAFLQQPGQAPDARCINAQSAPRFFTKTTVRFSPAIATALNAIAADNYGALITPALGVLILLSIFAVWPIALVVRLIRKQPWPRTALAALANWLALATGITGLGILVGMIVLISLLASQGDMTILFGLPSSWGWLLNLPWISALLAVAMLGAAAAAWRSGWWTIGGRLYYTLLALAAVAVAAGLIPFAL